MFVDIPKHTYKLENEFASVYPLMLFAESNANKSWTCAAGRAQGESGNLHTDTAIWCNLASFISIVSSLDTFEKNIFDVEHNITRYENENCSWTSWFLGLLNKRLSTYIFHCRVLLVVDEPGDCGPGVAARHHALKGPAPGLDHVGGRGGARDGHHRGQHWSQINTGILRPDAIPIQMAVNGALFIFRAM